MGDTNGNIFLRYSLAAVAVILAVVFRLLLDPVLNERLPFVTLFAAVTFIAWYGGRGPATLSLVLGLAGVNFFILDPRWSLLVERHEDVVGLVFYALISAGCIVLFEQLRMARARAEGNTSEARQQYQLLQQEAELRQKAEAALAGEGERLRVTLASIGDGVVTTDAQGRVTFLNYVAQQLTGWSEEEAHGLPLESVFHIVNETTRQPVENPALRCLREGRIVGLANHTILIAKDGTERPIDDSAAPIRDHHGGIFGSVLVFRDITERKRSEAALAERVRLLSLNAAVGAALVQGNDLPTMLQRCAEALVNNLEGAFARVWTLNAQGDVLELQASAGMYTHLDGPHSRVPVGKYKIGLIAEQKQPHLTNQVVGDPRVSDQEWAQREGMIAFAGYPLVVDDRLVGVTAMFARRKLSEATLEAMASVADEIAIGIERKTAQERLHEQREWLRVTLASIGDAVIATDTEGHVTFLNGVAQNLTGWTMREADGKPLDQVFVILNEQSRKPVESPVAKVLREGAVVGLGNHTVLIAKDGTECPIDDSAAPIRDGSGKMLGVVLIFRDVTEQRRAQQLVQASEARKSAILETALDCIITMDHEGKVVEFNPAAERTFGYARAQVIGKPLAEFIIPPSLRGRHYQGLKHYLTTGEGPVLGQRLELPALRSDGSEFPAELAITRISTSGPPLFTAYLRDITEARRAEQRRNVRLAVSQVLSHVSSVHDGTSGVLRAVCEHLGWNVGFLWLVRSGSSLACEASWHRPDVPVADFEADSCARTFARGEGLPGRVWQSGEPAWLLDISLDENFPRLASAARNGLHSAFACPVVVGDRMLGVIEFFTNRIHEPDPELLEMMGTVAGMVGQFIERKAAEDELRRSEAELSDFFENATVGLHWVGPDGTILRANQAELDMLGYSREEYIGRPIAHIHADEEVICDILNRLKVGERLREYPARLKCKDGSIKDVLIDSSVLWRDGEFVHTRCFTRDVTERKRAERELREAQRRLEAIFNQQFQFMAILGPDGTVLEANETCFRATGVAREKVLGKLFWETPWWSDLPAVQAQWKRHVSEAAQGRGPVTGQVEYALADGTIRHATAVVTGLKDEKGQVTNVVVEGQDDTERKRNEAVLVAQKRVLELLVHGAPLPDVLDSLCEVAEEQAQHRLVATVLLVDEDGKRLRSVAGRRAPLEYARAVDGIAIGPHTGACGTAAYRREQVIISDIATDPLCQDFRDLALQHGFRACWSSPIFSSQGTVLGTFALYYSTPGRPSPDELRLVEILTRTAGVAIERRRDEAILREQTGTTEALYRIGRLLAEELDLHKLVQVVTDEGTRLSGAQFGAFFYNVTGDRGEAYTLYTVSGVPLEAFSRFPMPRSTELFGPTFRGEGTVRLADVTQDPRYGKSPPYYGMPEGHLPVRSYLAVPVVSRSGEVLGGLFFGHAEAGVFSSSHERLLLGVAGQAAVAIDNARLYQRAQASAERLNLALSAADLGDWSWDAANDLVTFSERAAEVFGIPPGPHLTWTEMQTLLHPDDRKRARQEVERVVAERVQYDIDYRVVRHDGTLVWVGVLGRATYDSAGQVVGMYGVVQDITERKSLEESLRSSEERLRLALDAGRMGVWDWNIRTGDLKWSDSLEPLHGLAPGTFGGTFEDFQKLIHPDDRAKVNGAIRRALEHGDGYDIEFRNVRPQGGIRWIAGTGKVYAGEDGQPARMIGIGMDITPRKRAEQTARFLADASAALAVIVDFDSTLQKVASLAVPYFADWATVDMVEQDGTLRRVAVAHVDPGKVELAHELQRRFPPDPTAPHGAWSILRTGRSEILRHITDEVLAQNIRNEEQLSIVRELGLKSYIGVPLKVRGKTLGVLTFIAAESGHLYDETDLAVAQDLADRTAIAVENSQLYGELRDADRRKDEFLATLAHELRNPLAPIRNGLQVLRLAGSENTVVSEARSMMERQLNQMVRLVDDLLDVSRITRNKLDLRKQRVELAAVVHSAVETSRPLIEQAGHTFSLTLPTSPIYLDADLTRLAQVFSNLLNNSAKYTEMGGHISLTAEVIGDEVAVRVRDNGLGIPAEALPRLFEMFSQVDRNMERAQGGLGIGLTLVRRLTEMHGGTVEVRSDGPGQGSEFTVRLPILKDKPAGAPGLRPGEGHAEAATKRRVLIVDDNQDSAMSLGMMLKLLGNETRTAHDGVAAVEAAAEFRPDVVLLDIGLPKLNGYDACRRIREQPWSSQMVMVALTGWGQEEDRRRSSEAGFDHHLVKPVELAALAGILQTAPPS